MTSTAQDNAASSASSNLDDSNTVEMSKEAAALENAHDESLAGSPPSPRDIHGFRWVLAVVAVVSSILLYATDNTIVGSGTTHLNGRCTNANQYRSLPSNPRSSKTSATRNFSHGCLSAT